MFQTCSGWSPHGHWMISVPLSFDPPLTATTSPEFLLTSRYPLGVDIYLASHSCAALGGFWQVQMISATPADFQPFLTDRHFDRSFLLRNG